MQEVQYSRILQNRTQFSYLFIRDFPLCAFFRVSSGLLFTFLLLSSASATNPVAELKEKEEFNLKSEIVLQTCCAYQRQYNFTNGQCADGGNKNSSQDLAFDYDPSLKIFPETFDFPEHIVSKVYRNVTRDRKFWLKQQLISCPNGTVTINVTLNSSEILPKKRQITSFTPVNGFLRHNFDVFYPDEYCFNKIEEDEIEIIACLPECSEEKPCVPKCCDVGQVWDLSEYPDGPARCAYAGENQWEPQIYKKLKARKPLENLRPHIVLSHPRFWCDEYDSIIHTLKPFLQEKKTPFRILDNGEIWYKFDRRKWAPFTKGTYCVDGHFIRSGVDNKGEFSGNYEDTIVWDCGPPLVTPKSVGTSEIYGISMVIAAFFLLITIIVYILLWDKQNVHGWTLLCYFTSLFFMYIFYSAVHFTNLTLTQDVVYGGGTMCYIIGVCAHFFFLSSFCFMSAVNFDLWWTFRALMPTGGKSKGIKKFLAYNLFSLGIPTVIVAVGITLDALYSDDMDSDIIIPEYGKRSCFLDRTYATLPYLHGPAGVLLTCNLVFFTVTVYTMYKIQQSTKFATQSSSKNAKQKQSMILFGKLFLVMGLPWVFEVISSTTVQGPVLPFYFKIMDLINIFQAVAIFLIFVMKTDIRNSLENKYPRFKRFMIAITIRPERADSILRRHPKLRFIINPLTRSITSTKSFSTAKTTLSNGTEGSTSSRAHVLGRRDSDGVDSTSSSSARSSPSGSLSVRKEQRKRPSPPIEILELK